MNTAVIISGGKLERDFALDFLKETPYDILIGADRGICFLRDQGIMPTHIVGDFDSAARDALAYFRKFPGIPIREFNPVKDLTDTQIALELALEKGAGKIFILGCTGSRVDHVFANIRILNLALEKGAECFLLDAHNRIRLTDKPLSLPKEKQYGKYVSLFAFGETVKGITLKGFYYPLTNYDMVSGDAIGVSNEIVGNTGDIFLKSGRLLVMESKD